MADHVPKVLSHYTSDPGTKTNVSRLLRSGKVAGMKASR